VLFLLTTLDRGGAEKAVTRLALGLPRSKYAVRVGALQGRSGSVAADLAGTPVPVHDLRMRGKWDAGVAWRLARLLRRERIAILFAFLFHPTVVSRLVGRACGVPIRISSERIMDWEGRSRRLVNRWTVPLATHVVAVSDRVAAYARSALRVPAERLSTIPNGVDVERFRPPASRGGSGEPVIGCTARLHRKNDHASLVRAFARITPGWPEARLLLVGRGPEEAGLRGLAKALGVASRVRFVGEQADVAPFLAEMDLYVQPSVAEGMPNSILEAMAAGLPVVATAVGGTPEVVIDGETGLLVPPGDSAALAAAVTRCLRDPVALAAFGRAGRARVEAHFGEAAMLSRVEALLDRLVGEELHRAHDAERGWKPC
jgi:glycosyltransferase involved in cell wall biosynthesis